MEEQVQRLFGEQLLRESASRFGLAADSFKKLGDFENYVFEAVQDGKPVILRLTHSSHRSQDEIQAELDWIAYLVQNGLAGDIPACLPSGEGSVTERLLTGDTYFTACLFEKAPGKLPDFKDPAVWNLDLFREWGALTGRMHRATQHYHPANGSPRRLEWDEDDLFLRASDYVPAAETEVLGRLEAILARLNSLPRTASGYGLIHTDIHPRNFFIDYERRLTVFDFDDAAYNWFVHDLAIPVYYAVSWATPESYAGDRTAFAQDFFAAFWDGYSAEYPLPEEWLGELPLFLQLRDVVLYLVLHKKEDVAALPERVRIWLREIRERIGAGRPLVELDFHSLTQAGR